MQTSLSWKPSLSTVLLQNQNDQKVQNKRLKKEYICQGEQVILNNGTSQVKMSRQKRLEKKRIRKFYSGNPSLPS